MTNARDKANIPVLNFQSKGIDDNADATAITIDSSERVGLNTTTPGAKIEINSTGSYYNTANQHQQWSYNGTPFLSLYMDAYASPYFDTDSASSWNPGATMVFKRQGSEKFRITNAGSVGIGTSAPSKILHVSSNDPVIRLTDTDTGATHNLSGSSSARNFDLEVDTGSTSGSPRFALKIHDGLYYTQTKTEAVFNEESNDVDFRVESNGNANMLFVDGGNDRVGIGETAPLGLLHVKTADSGASVNSGHNQVIAENSGNSGMTILSGTSSNGAMCFGDSGNNCIGYINYAHNGDHLDFGVNNAERMRIHSSGKVSIGTSTADGILIVTDNDNETYLVVQNAKSGGSGEGVLSLKNDVGNWQVKVFTDDTFRIRDNGNGADRFTIDTSGNVLIGKTANNLEVAGCQLEAAGTAAFTRSGAFSLVCNRHTDDGELVSFRQANNIEGSISVSGSTVSYNGFTGTHWSRFQDNSTPTILRGTVLETLDEMCDWYNLEFDVITQDNDGNDVTTTKKVPHVLLDSQSDGDVITYNHEGTDYQATITKEGDVKHMMSKVSDTTDAKNVYGLFVAYDLDGEGYNDFYVASVGSFVVRIKSGETLAKGDLLQSNGDGTAKVQSDDNIKSSSFAKVLSTTIIETYEDGSYLVPCSLMC